MKKMRIVGTAAVAAGLLLGGAGVAAADNGAAQPVDDSSTPTTTSTGSATLTQGLVNILASGSAASSKGTTGTDK
ncbi:hypothetical protein [Nocardia sp. BMG111209]|uniref:hypothetical protein n=1 Tax=Nocardia sp. BMG111209 TaxID=1160137 RepID=UPI000380B77E|nr:hypothetical protein [Nocardia sp. BMG111209]